MFSQNANPPRMNFAVACGTCYNAVAIMVDTALNNTMGIKKVVIIFTAEIALLFSQFNQLLL